MKTGIWSPSRIAGISICLSTKGTGSHEILGDHQRAHRRTAALSVVQCKRQYRSFLAQLLRPLADDRPAGTRLGRPPRLTGVAIACQAQAAGLWRKADVAPCYGIVIGRHHSGP